MFKYLGLSQWLSEKRLGVLIGFVFLGLFGSSAQAQIEMCFTGGAIPDGSGSATPGTPLVRTITYDDSDVAFTDPILDLNFNLAINHTWVGDLIVTLTSPAGTVVTLINRPGTPPGTFGCSRNNIDVLLDDEAATTAESQCSNPSPAIAGTQQPNGSLSAFDGETLEGTWTLTVTDNARFDTGSLLGTTCIDSSTTTPVTLGLFESKLKGDRLQAKWQTSSETFNVGFNLWGLTASNNWIQLNKRIIKSKRGNTLTTQNYKAKVNLNQLDDDILAVGISSVSSTSKEDFFGPFEFGKRYGAEEVPDFIDWEKERQAYNQAMEAAGYVYIKGRYKRVTPQLETRLQRRKKRQQRRQQRFPTVNILPSETGLQRITHADLLNAGVNWENAPIKHIAVSLHGKPVDRLVRGASRNKQFTQDSDIIFAAVPPQGDNKRYLADNVYQLSINHDLVSSAGEVGSVKTSQLASSHAVHIAIGENKFYANNMPGPEPWLDTELFATSSQTSVHSVNFVVEGNINLSMPASIKLNLLGGIDFPNVDVDGDGVVEPDHHVRLYLNKTDNPDPIWEGYGEGFSLLALEAPIDAAMLISDSLNELTIELIADSGNGLDIMSFDDGVVEYFKTARLDESGDGSVVFSESRANISGYQFASDLPDDGDLQVFAYDVHNHLVQLETSLVESQEGVKQLAFSALANEATSYEIVRDSSEFKQADIELVSVIVDEAVDPGDAELLIISDPAFINADLEAFAEFHRSELNRPSKIVSTLDIYNRYGYAMATPDAINRYLREVAEDSSYSSVLLVGGHTYNYLGYGNQQSTPLINSIPGYYADIQDVYEQQAPTENPFVDLDGDSVPDKAIGRWPVRNAEQLKNIIDKTIIWHTNGSIAEAQSALLIAEGGDEGLFKETIEELIPFLGSDNDSWTSIKKVYIDDIAGDQNIPVSGANAAAKLQIKQAIDEGSTLTVFSGHGSPSRWSFQNLVTPATVSSWENQGKPTMMLPLACYTSYYETISTNTLAHRMLLADDNAAVAISSAAVLAIEAHNKEFVRRLLIELTQNNRSIGDSVMLVKQDLAATSSDYADIVTSWTTLADPTLSLHRIPLERIEQSDNYLPYLEQEKPQ